MADPLPENPYLALGVPKDATTEAVTKAYRKLVLTCHPDKTKSLPEALRKEKEEQFHRIREAKELLTNEKARQRYDDRCQLEELRSELKNAHPGLHKAATFSYKTSSRPNASKTTSSPIFETRGPPVYETRSPKGSYDEEYGSPRYEEPRRKYDDRYFEVPPGGSRRNSGRSGDDRRTQERRDEDEERARRKARETASKAEQRSLDAERKRTREKTRRKDYDSKRYAQNGSDTDTDSDVDRFMGSSGRTKVAPEPRKRYEDTRDMRRSKQDDRHRRARSSSSDFSDDSRTYDKVKAAAEHIKKSGGRMFQEREGRHEKRAAATKSHSARTPPPPAPPSPHIDSAKRSSKGRGVSAAKSVGKKLAEIVDPPPRRDYEYDTPKRSHATSVSPTPDLKSSSSQRTAHVPRATTFNDRVADRLSEKVPSPLRRAQTTPHERVQPQSTTRPSKLKHSETHDTGSSSPASPHEPPSRHTTTRYQYVGTDDEDDSLGPRVIHVEPDHGNGRHRDARGGSSHQFSERGTLPHHGSTHRSTLGRSQTQLVDMSGPVRGTPARKSSLYSPHHEHHRSNDESSGRDRKLLFNEFRGGINFSPELKQGDIRYAEVRRSSVDTPSTPRGGDRGVHADHKDGFPFTVEGRAGKGGHTPAMNSRSSYFAQESY